MLREVLAPNASPMTFDGTRTFLVGQRSVVVLDPGSEEEAHLDAVARAIGDGVCTGVIVTHEHPDHADGAAVLAERLRAPVRRFADGTLQEGERLETGAGHLVVLATPGHTPDHVALHWPEREAVFCGDLMMGGADTALVAWPEGDLGAYLGSLERLRRLRPRIIHPAHGPDIRKPLAVIDRYVEHRAERQRQVLAALEAGATDLGALVDAVYGDALPPGFRQIAGDAVRAYVEHLIAQGLLGRDAAWDFGGKA